MEPRHTKLRTSTESRGRGPVGVANATLLRRTRELGRRSWLILALLSLLLARVSWAQEIGTIGQITGSVEIGRAGTWTAATVGAPLNLHDEVRTGEPGRLMVVFRDDSVLVVGDGSHVRIDEQIFDPTGGKFRSVMRLLQGKLRALVSEYYERPQATYLIETGTAAVGVRGTEFVITFDPVADVTDVVGVSGRAEVHSVIDLVKHGVFLTAREITTVARGRLPTPPQRLTDEMFRQYLEGLEFIGGGRAESLTSAQPLFANTVVPEADRAAVVIASSPAPGAAAPAGPPLLPSESVQHGTDASSLVGQPIPVINESKLGIRF
jgi:FecR protein